MSSYLHYFAEMMRRRVAFLKADVAGINWTGLTYQTEKYAYGTAGIEFTWRKGAGVGLGLGTVDLWFGFPRKVEMLHYQGCPHKNRFGAPYKNLKPKELVEA